MRSQKSKLWELQQANQNGGECVKCKRMVGYLTVDHIVPASFVMCLDNGKYLAVNDEENFQMLCQPCNKMKGASWDFTNSATIKLLVKYLQPYGVIKNNY